MSHEKDIDYGLFALTSRVHGLVGVPGDLVCRIREITIVSMPRPHSYRFVFYKVGYWTAMPQAEIEYAAMTPYVRPGDDFSEFGFKIPTDVLEIDDIEKTCIHDFLTKVMRGGEEQVRSTVLANMLYRQQQGRCWALEIETPEHLPGIVRKQHDLRHWEEWGSLDGQPVILQQVYAEGRVDDGALQVIEDVPYLNVDVYWDEAMAAAMVDPQIVENRFPVFIGSTLFNP